MKMMKRTAMFPAMGTGIAIWGLVDPAGAVELVRSVLAKKVREALKTR